MRGSLRLAGASSFLLAPRCSSCTDTAGRDPNACFPAGTPESQQVCASGWTYGIQCFDRIRSSACPIERYQQKTCYKYDTCRDPSFGVESRGTYSTTHTVYGHYEVVEKCVMKSTGVFCTTSNKAVLDETCQQRAESLKSKLPTADQAYVTYTYTQSAITGDGESTCSATCNITFQGWPTYNLGSSSVCPQIAYSCDDTTKPIYSECRHSTHPPVTASLCGPVVRTTGPNTSLAQLREEAQKSWEQAYGVGPVVLSPQPVCRDCTDSVPSDVTNGITPGTIAGKPGVSADGAATYSIPLWVPEGRAGVKPELGLEYNSRGGNGVLGMGWSLKGVSRITLCPRTWLLDGEAAPAKWDGSGPYCLDGQRLLETSSGSGEYRLENDSFLRVRVERGTDGVDGFKAYLKDGRILTFGGSRTGARIEGWRLQVTRAAPNSVDPEAVVTSKVWGRYGWNLARVEDRSGNFIDYEYSNVPKNWNDDGVENVLTKIVYTGHSSGAPLPARSITFEYGVRVNNFHSYVGGMKLSLDSVLNRIVVRGPTPGAPGAVLRRYDFVYDGGATITSRGRLGRLYECDGRGICKPPLTFQWTSGNYNFTRIATGIRDVAPPTTDPYGKANAAWALYTGDFNGDGRDDLLYRKGRTDLFEGTWYLRLNSASGFGPAYLAGIPKDIKQSSGTRLIDLDRDGRTDLVRVRNFQDGTPEYWTRWTLSSSGTFVEDLGWAELATGPLFHADVNGDGLSDRIQVRQAAGGARPIWGVRAAGAPDYLVKDIETYANHPPYVATLETGGHATLLISRSISTWYGDAVSDSFRNIFSGLRLSAGGFGIKDTTLADYPATWAGGTRTYWFADINGDGLSDALDLKSDPNNLWVIAIRLRRNIDGEFAPEEKLTVAAEDLPPSQSNRYVTGDSGLRAIDWNLDGREDLLSAQALVGRTHMLPLLSTYYGALKSSPDRPIPLGDDLPTWHAAHVQLVDYNADGFTDVLQLEQGEVVVYARQPEVPDVMTQVTNGLGAKATFEYAPLLASGVYDTVASAPQTPGTFGVRPGLFVVKRLSTDNGLGGQNDTTYAYKDGRVDRLQGFLGFEQVTSTDSATGTVTRTNYGLTTRTAANQYPLARVPVYTRSDVWLNTPETLVSESRTSFEVLESGKTYRVRPLRTTSASVTVPTSGPAIAGPNSSWLYGSSTRPPVTVGAVVTSSSVTDYEYDAYDNATRAYTQVVASNGTLTGETREETAHYLSDAATWLLARPDWRASTHRLADGTSATRRQDFETDPATGLVTATVAEKGTAQELRTTYQRNRYGLPSAVTTTGDGKVRLTTLAYENTEESLVAVSTDGMGLATRRAYHVGFNVPVAETSPDGVTTRFQYDDFGRLVRTDLPGSTTPETVSYGWSSDGRLEIVSRHAGGGTTTVRQDVLGREVQRTTTGMDGSLRYSETEYNAPGWVARRSAAHLGTESAVWTSYEYDKAGRTCFVRYADGTAEETRHYPLRTVSIDGRGSPSFAATDVTGRVVESGEGQDAASAPSTVRFTYGPFNTPYEAKVYTAGTLRVTTRQVHDHLGRRIRIEEYVGASVTPRVLESTTYTAFGEVESSTDALGQVTRLKYDADGRLTSKETPEGTHQFAWDTSKLGRLGRTQSADGITTTFAYDAFGRPALTRLGVGGESFDVDRSYDSAGRLSTLTYPNVPGVGAPRFRYAYAINGQLQEVKNDLTGASVWLLEKQTPQGLNKQERFGNGLVSTRLYDEKRFTLTGISTSVGALGTTLQSVTYGYDANLNVMSRWDARLLESEVYEYDTQNRLVHWTYNYPFETTPLTSEQRWAYDSLGRLTERAILAGPGEPLTLAYDGAGAVSPYAPTSSSLGAYTYDLQGNQLTGPGRSVTWTSFGLPRQVVRSGVSTASYKYGVDHERVMKETVQGETVVYVGGLYERRRAGNVDTHVLYVGAGAQLVAQVAYQARNASLLSTELLYVHPDNLGSPELLTDTNGAVVTRMRFEPFGRRTEVAEPARPLAATFSSSVRKGFTGHEMEDDLQLINMKGRIYDPMVGHFLSPDPFVQSPRNPRAYNRYAYVHYNPLTLTDPTGFVADGAPKQGELPRDWVVSTPNAPGGQSTYAQAVCAAPAVDDLSKGSQPASTQGSPVLSFWSQDLRSGLDVLGSGIENGLQRDLKALDETVFDVSYSANPVLPDAVNSLLGRARDHWSGLRNVDILLVQLFLSRSGGQSRENVASRSRQTHSSYSTLGPRPEAPSPSPEPESGGGSASFSNLTTAELDAAVNAQGRSDLMMSLPAPTGARLNHSGGMMVNEFTVQSSTSASGATGNVATRVRVHSADPTAPAGSNSATGNTVSITQGGGARRLVPGEGWVQTSTATGEQMNQSHIPIHRD